MKSFEGRRQKAEGRRWKAEDGKVEGGRQNAECRMQKGRSLLHSAFCILHSAFCLLPSAFCLLPLSFHSPLIRRSATPSPPVFAGGEGWMAHILAAAYVRRKPASTQWNMIGIMPPSNHR